MSTCFFYRHKEIVLYRSKFRLTLKSHVYFQRLSGPCETFPLGVLGGKMIKKGIWKILLRNDRLKKSRVRRFKKQLERSNNRLAASSRLSLSLVLLKQGGRWDTEPKRTQSHQSSFQFAEDFETLRLREIFIVVEKKKKLV